VLLTFLPGETAVCWGILSRLLGPGVRWRPAGVSLTTATPAPEVGRQPLKGREVPLWFGYNQLSGEPP
jgi:hypothetical protein